MKIGLIDIDSKIPNLALMKISAHYKKINSQVELTSPLFASHFDWIYASKIYTWTEMPILPPDSYIGGSGYDLHDELPADIERAKPDYDLYPDMEYSLGFTTRGCIRNCPFCIVPEKEGGIKAVADIYDIWDQKHKKIVLLDNNILAMPDHFFKITDQLLKEKLKVDFNQGLDHRLLTDDICERLHKISHTQYHFAFDLIAQEKSVLKSIQMLKKHGLNFNTWFVLIGYNTLIQEDLFRVELLKKRGQRVFVQKYNNQSNEYMTAIARWANNHAWFSKITFKEFLERPENNYPAVLEANQ